MPSRPNPPGSDRFERMRVREPFNAGSHFIGFLLAALGTWYLLRAADGRSQLLAFGIYGATLLLLYGASTCYHGLQLSATGLRRLRPWITSRSTF